jgi:hypothetical protein
MRGLFAWLGVDDGHWSPGMAERRNSAPEPAQPLSAVLRDRLRDAVRDDADRLRAFTGQAFGQWSV